MLEDMRKDGEKVLILKTLKSWLQEWALERTSWSRPTEIRGFRTDEASLRSFSESSCLQTSSHMVLQGDWTNLAATFRADQLPSLRCWLVCSYLNQLKTSQIRVFQAGFAKTISCTARFRVCFFFYPPSFRCSWSTLRPSGRTESVSAALWQSQGGVQKVSRRLFLSH